MDITDDKQLQKILTYTNKRLRTRKLIQRRRRRGRRWRRRRKGRGERNEDIMPTTSPMMD